MGEKFILVFQEAAGCVVPGVVDFMSPSRTITSSWEHDPEDQA